MEVHAPKQVAAVQSQMAELLLHGIGEVAIHKTVQFFYYSQELRQTLINNDYPRFITEDNLVNTEDEDYGEDLEHAAIREVKEETGLDIFNLKYRYKTFGNHMLYFTFTAETNNELNDVRLQAGETMDYKWIKANEFKELFDSDKVPDKQRFRLKKAIEEFVK